MENQKFYLKNKEYFCPTQLAIDVLSGKWKIMILYKLFHNVTLRYGELKKQMPKMSDKVLTQQLKELEENRLVNRIVVQSIPPKVEYSLTARGREIESILKALGEFGKNFSENQMEPKNIPISGE
jgi:DNA-binding HxlR family transcriptional regulator